MFLCKNSIRYYWQRISVVLVVVMLGISAESLQGQSYNTNFDNGDDGWIGSAIGFSVSDPDSYQMRIHWNVFMNPNTGNEKGTLFFRGKNLNGSLFLYAFKHVKNLKPNSVYNISFNILLYTKPRENQNFGKIYLKGGALNKIPSNLYVEAAIANFDKGDLGVDGADLKVLDVISISNNIQKYIVQTYTKPISCRTNSKGELFLIFAVEPENKVQVFPDIYLSSFRASFAYQGKYVQEENVDPFQLFELANKEGFYFDSDLESDLHMISLYNMSGHLIQVIEINRPFYDHVIGTKDLEPGSYQVVFILKNKKKYLKEIQVIP